jgi:signal transduction histidine kinase
MINLIPANTTDLDYLWELVSERNKWFIKLRYAAVVMLVSLYVFIVFFSGEKLSNIQYKGIIAIFVLTLIYNLILSYLFNSGKIRNDIRKFNPIKFAFLQIVFDLISLMVLVYLTGLINSPFYLFFIFHAIIGSMILPGRLVYGIVFAVLIIFSFLTLSVHFEFIGEFLISNTGSVSTLKTTYVFLNLISFWLMMLVSVMFSNNLASALYKRDQQLIEAIYELELSEKEKQRYVLAIVHELKSPVSAIVSYLNLLIGGIAGEINDKAKDILLKMKKRSEESITLTNNIIEVSKVKLLDVIRKEKIDPEIIVTGIIEKIKDKFSGAKILFTYDDSRVTDNAIYADENLIKILFSNIISNAIKYTPSGGEVTLKLFDSENKDRLCISLSDTGIGIPPDEINKISDEFYRASNVKKNKVEGIGLGLSVVKKIIEQHNGSMKIMSPNGIGNEDFPGTTINIEIPYVENKDELVVSS